MSKYLYIFISLMFLTPLRALTTYIMPIFVIMFMTRAKIKFNKKSKIFLVFVVLSTLFGIVQETTYVQNVFDFYWRYIPIMIFALTLYKVKCYKAFDLDKFVNISSKILIIIDILGYLFYFLTNSGEDGFGRAYTTHFQGVHGLAMVNVIYFFYYFSKLMYEYDKRILLKSFFFFASFFFCFYGLGFVIFILCMSIFLVLKYLKKLKALILILSVAAVSAIIVNRINPHFFEYTLINLTIGDEDDLEQRRKLLLFMNYEEYFNKEFPLSLIGTGPGGFCSRTAFDFNVEGGNKVANLIGHTMPIHHKEYVYPLRNKWVTSFEEGTDGTRNQPFSSILSILAELGIVPAFIFVGFYILLLIRFYINSKKNYLYTYLFLANLFFIICSTIEMWIESTEFLFLLIFNLIVYSNIIKDKYDTQNHTLLLVR